MGIWTAFAAALLRSRALSVGTVLIAVAWLAVDGGWFGVPSWRFLIAMIVLWVISFWVKSAETRALILLSLMLWGTMFYVVSGSVLIPLVMAIASGALFVAATGSTRPTVERYTGLGQSLPVLGLLGFLLSMVLIQFAERSLGIAMLVAAITLGATVAALLMAGRDNRKLRWLAYAGFTAELIFLYVTLLGSMIGSAAFFLASGFVLAIIAIIIRRFERRFARAAT